MIEKKGKFGVYETLDKRRITDYWRWLSAEISFQMSYNKISETQMCQELGISRPTFDKYMRNPEMFTAYHLVVMKNLFCWRRGEVL